MHINKSSSQNRVRNRVTENFWLLVAGWAVPRARAAYDRYAREEGV